MVATENVISCDKLCQQQQQQQQQQQHSFPVYVTHDYNDSLAREEHKPIAVNKEKLQR